MQCATVPSRAPLVTPATHSTILAKRACPLVRGSVAFLLIVHRSEFNWHACVVCSSGSACRRRVSAGGRLLCDLCYCLAAALSAGVRMIVNDRLNRCPTAVAVTVGSSHSWCPRSLSASLRPQFCAMVDCSNAGCGQLFPPYKKRHTKHRRPSAFNSAIR